MQGREWRSDIGYGVVDAERSYKILVGEGPPKKPAPGEIERTLRMIYELLQEIKKLLESILKPRRIKFCDRCGSRLP